MFLVVQYDLLTCHCPKPARKFQLNQQLLEPRCIRWKAANKEWLYLPRHSCNQEEESWAQKVRKDGMVDSKGEKLEFWHMIPWTSSESNPKIRDLQLESHKNCEKVLQWRFCDIMTHDTDWSFTQQQLQHEGQETLEPTKFTIWNSYSYSNLRLKSIFKSNISVCHLASKWFF